MTAAQYILRWKGYADVALTGRFDQPTWQAVQHIQRLHGLRPNGVVDASTWCVLAGGIVRESLR